MASDLVQRTANYVRLKLLNEPTGHDWLHVERVWRIARRLHKEEGGDLELLELAVLLHDLGDYKQFDFDEKKAALVLRGMMDVLSIEEELQKKIVKIIDEAQYIGSETKSAKTIEGKILQDADWLDALGAIGIARTFATGGRIRRMLYDPKRKPRKKLNRDDYLHRKQEGTSINYFVEKVLKLPTMMNTKTAKEIGQKRAEFIKNYLREFLAEWRGEK